MVEVLQALGLAKGIESISKDKRLRLCISSSLEQMPSNDRLALAMLSMFPNKFDVSAATAVLRVSRLATIQCLERLRLKCWVRDISDKYYQLHLLIRDMAADTYEHHPDCLAAKQAFISYYLSMLQSVEPEYVEAGVKGMQQLRSQRLNLIKAFQELALQATPVPSEELMQHCHLGLTALRALTRLRVDSATVVQAMRKLLMWAEAAENPEAVASAREQLGYVLATMPSHWQEAERELTAALAAHQLMHGSDHLSSAAALTGLAALFAAKACDASSASSAEQQAIDYVQQLYQVLCNKGKGDPETVLCAIDGAHYMPNSTDKLGWLEQSHTAAKQKLGSQHPVVLLLKFEQIKLKAKSDFPGIKDIILKLRQNLESCTEQQGSQGNLTINALICLGTALARSQQAEEQQEGLQRLHQAVEAMAATYSKEDKEVLCVQLDDLVPSLIWAQQADAACELLSKLKPMFIQKLGANSMIMVNLLRQHAAACCSQDKYSEGEKSLREAISKAKMQASNETQQISFVIKQGLYLELASNLEEQGRWVCVSKSFLFNIQMSQCVLQYQYVNVLCHRIHTKCELSVRHCDCTRTCCTQTRAWLTQHVWQWICQS